MSELVAKMAPIADRYVGRFISKRFLVWLTGTALLWLGHVPAETWQWVTAVYIGQQGVHEAVRAFRGNE